MGIDLDGSPIVAHHAIGWRRFTRDVCLDPVEGGGANDLTLFSNKQFNAAVAVGVVFGAATLVLAMQCLFLYRPSKVSRRQSRIRVGAILASC